jgi:hypothetical protein
VVPPNEPATIPRLYMSGGWNALGQFKDFWMFDLETCVWSIVASATDAKWYAESLHWRPRSFFFFKCYSKACGPVLT